VWFPLKIPFATIILTASLFPAETDFNCLCPDIAWTLSAVVVLVFSHSICPHFRPLRRDTRPRVSADCRYSPPCHSEWSSSSCYSEEQFPPPCHSEERSDVGIFPHKLHLRPSETDSNGKGGAAEWVSFPACR